MNTHIHTIRHRIAACAAVAIVIPAFTACGAEVEPPTQDIGRQEVDTKKIVPTPERTSGNRYEFGDEYGKAAVKQRKGRRAAGGTHSRMDFEKYHGR